jgi:tRNA(fMet)-specific endonuclease VapC
LAFLIDTNIAIHARDGGASVLEKFFAHEGLILMSALSLAELQRGLYKSGKDMAIRQSRLKTILRSIPILPFDEVAAEAYGQIIAQIGWAKGKDYDRMIGAHAVASGNILVTANVADFSDIPNLKLENWTIGQ